MWEAFRINRREFLKRTGLAAGVGVAHSARSGAGGGVSIILSPDDPINSKPPVTWAAKELEQSLAAQGISVHHHQRIDQAAANELCIVVSGADRPQARRILASANAILPAVPESFGLVRGKSAGRPVLLACGADVRGLVYALLEIADRIHYARQPFAALEVHEPVVEKPANPLRSVNRCFQSDVEDKPWYNDRAMWPPYLSMLAAQRFNRFSLTFGLGYDFPRHIRDAYFYFAYPFLVSPTGYTVRAVGLANEERDQNLAMLRFISDEAAARGLDFQLGLWTHAYQWADSPNANYTIEGLTPANHPAYCRDALAALLKACPSINGVTFRVHGESGIAEGSYSFWKTLFDGVVRAGRPIEINLHAKGIDQPMIDVALATGMPVTVSPKYWAEHMGLPYQPASIRELEMPHQDKKAGGFFELSSGSRSFMRYSYGDLFKEDRPYGIFFRIWPGTQRALLWGNPTMAAADGRAAGFCGSLGMDLFEPLSFKGRHGSGLPGGRCAYADESLKPSYDWEKFLYTYRVWGRKLYNPTADPDGWQRFLRQEFQAAAPATENALGHASRILRLVTTAHCPSAANNNYWPEIYTNMPIVDAAKNHLYTDTPSPKLFSAVSPLDPEIFSRVNDFAGELLSGQRNGKYSPLEVAQWLEDLSATAVKHLAQAESKSGNSKSVAFRRMAADVNIQCGLGRFFAWKLRSGVLYALHQQTNNLAALQEALSAYRRARACWAEFAVSVRDVYMADITYGIEAQLRGHWFDRLPQIDDDIADMEKLLEPAKTQAEGYRESDRVSQAIRDALAAPTRTSAPCRHTPPAHFQPGQSLEIDFALEKTGAPAEPITVRLNYRHVNQSEVFRTQEMQAANKHFRASIPGDHTESPYPLQYYFELRSGPGNAWLYPGLGIALSDQPYFIVRRESTPQSRARSGCE